MAGFESQRQTQSSLQNSESAVVPHRFTTVRLIFSRLQKSLECQNLARNVIACRVFLHWNLPPPGCETAYANAGLGIRKLDLLWRLAELSGDVYSVASVSLFLRFSPTSFIIWSTTWARPDGWYEKQGRVISWRWLKMLVTGSPWGGSQRVLFRA